MTRAFANQTNCSCFGKYFLEYDLFQTEQCDGAFDGGLVANCHLDSEDVAELRGRMKETGVEFDNNFQKGLKVLNQGA